MKNNSLEQALSRAVVALRGISKKEIGQLSLSDCALMLTALPDTELLSGLRMLLAQRLRGRLSTAQIEQGDAYEVYLILTALWKYDPACITGEWLAAAIHRLVQSEAAEGGPYYIGNTIAVAPNVQIAIFVSTVAMPLPNMTHLIKAVVADRRFYQTELTSFALLYLLSTVCDCEGLASYVKGNRQCANWRTPWHKVVAMAVLKDRVSQAEISQTLLAVCGKQQQDGFWKGEPFAKGARRNSSSSAVTTALIVQALYDHVHPVTNAASLRRQQQRQVIASAAARVLGGHAEPLRSSVLTAADRICSADYNFEITLLPQFFANALESPRRFTNAQHTMLGLANVCVWVAYSIYDDFIDDEGKPAELPVANVAMRASMDCFRVVLPENTRFHKYVRGVFDGMDEANAWEVDHCRFAVSNGKIEITELPKYGKCTILAARAFAHALTPMALLTLCSASSIEQSYIETAFRHYLIARQLNDDLHDWVKDTQAGQASYVVTAILRDMQVRQGGYELDTLLPAMRRRFRRTTMQKICQRMLWHIVLSKRHFVKSQLMHPTNDIYLLLDNLELSARQIMDKRAKSQALADVNPA